MNFSVFNESFYLAHNPDVQAAVNARILSSGLEHFQKFGLAEGRVSVSPFYDEQFYLRKNSDVATAVASGNFHSGLQHFILAGETEGRRASLLFDEQFYLRKNPDVAAAVTSGNLSSGLTHYLQFGQSENRSGTSFNEFAYSGITREIPPNSYNLEKVNPDVEAAVQAGLFGSTLEHYIKFGQFEDRGGGTFNGTTGNDTVVAFGQIDTLYGVDAYIGPELRGTTPTGGQALHLGFGVNEADVLFGGNGEDTFVLGQTLATVFYPDIHSYSVPFYRGNGDADYAWIRNYEIGKDEIVLAGGSWNYDFVQSGDSLNIFLNGENPDLIAKVEGVISVNEIQYKLQFTRGEPFL
ncbi:hypothetical protein NIES2119_20995 [[Phormidium ambiguum] IAM M-71]|uniref:Calcium-binding protein n=1 Tax=[Phormidium ambiguum] IAM M-71 TaxID=454136 RepID=A0A1U7IE54_9CYAN|nr:hypothetical protein [Phormidium ambiguum]OKH35249.1 hypothetical protein NIES2119_20995 [Phormidium ambiguum IAM M-71]